MTKITTQSGEWLFVEVPEGAHDFSIAKNILGNKFSLKYRAYVHAGKTKVTYGPHSKTKIEFHSSTETITEMQASEIVYICMDSVSGKIVGFMEYTPQWVDKYGEVIEDYGPHETALKSFQSLLKKHSLTGRYAILRKL